MPCWIGHRCACELTGGWRCACWQVVRAISAEPKVQRSILEAWDKERREEGGRLRALMGDNDQQQQQHRQIEQPEPQVAPSPSSAAASPEAVPEEPSSPACCHDRTPTDPMREYVMHAPLLTCFRAWSLCRSLWCLAGAGAGHFSRGVLA